MERIKITRSAVRTIYRERQHAAPDEFMGFGAGPAPGTLTVVYPLAGESSPTYFRVAPAEIARCTRRARADRLDITALVHSHPGSYTDHSGIDVETIQRTLPAGADQLFERPPHSSGVPAVVAQDEAHLPLACGLAQKYVVLGPSIPGTRGEYQRGCWSEVRTCFIEPAKPSAVIDGSILRLHAGNVQLQLRVPRGATLTQTTFDPSPVRTAKRYSVIMSDGGHLSVKCLLIQDVLGQTQTFLRDCEVELVDDEDFGVVLRLEDILSDAMRTGKIHKAALDQPHRKWLALGAGPRS